MVSGKTGKGKGYELGLQSVGKGQLLKNMDQRNCRAH